MPGGSPVTQAAIARLGVQVALPSRGDIARGLGWMPQVISGIFKAVNTKKNAVLEGDIEYTKNKLHDLAGTEANIRQSRDQFIRKAEQDSLQQTLRGFKESIKKGKSLAKDAFEEPYASGRMKKHMWKELGNIGYAGEKMFKKLYTSGKRGYEFLEEAARGYYAMDNDQRAQLLAGLESELTKRKDIHRHLQQEKKDLERAAKDEGWGGTTTFRGKQRNILESYEQVDKELYESGKAVDYANERWTFFGKTLNKNAEGTKAYNQEVRTTKERLQALVEKLREVYGGYDKLAIAITQRVQQAFQGFRSILQQSIITLTLFYYKLQQVVEGFMQFEKELINAQSIFQTTNETLYTLSNQIVRFGTQFGISYDNAAKGLYQFASAGLSAEDSIKVLNDTLKLSMAVQGDHNTISKLTTQVIFGFGLQMDQATEVTDKFAHAINKSLIEYQDLASAVKFSMPFFVSSGQSLDTLLGALQILTNRALEAGIAGRGLRQALAEFTQHADDNAAAFRKLGVEILDNEGNMYDLTHIAHQFNDAIGESSTDMEVMMTLMDDLNIRGSTAFILLVQNADEFSAAVQDLENSAGSAHTMAMIQQESLVNQIQILKNALMAPFLLADPAAVARGEMNNFAEAVHNVVAQLKALLIIEKDGNEVLSETGFLLREIAIRGVQQFGNMMEELLEITEDWTEAGLINIDMIKLYFLPLTITLKLVNALGGFWGKLILTLYVLNKTLALNMWLLGAYNLLLMASGITTIKWWAASELAFFNVSRGLWQVTIAGQSVFFTMNQILGVVAAATLGFVAMIAIGKILGDAFGPIVPVLLAVAAAIAAVWAASTWGANIKQTMWAWATIGLGVTALGLTLGGISSFAFQEPEEYDLSGYEAQLEGDVAFGGAGSTATEAIYVEKLVYTDSNVSEQMRTSAQMQKGATGAFV